MNRISVDHNQTATEILIDSGLPFNRGCESHTNLIEKEVMSVIKGETRDDHHERMEKENPYRSHRRQPP